MKEPVVCPECLEPTEGLVDFQGSQMCPECAAEFENKDAQDEMDFEDSMQQLEEDPE